MAVVAPHLLLLLAAAGTDTSTDGAAPAPVALTPTPARLEALSATLLVDGHPVAQSAHPQVFPDRYADIDGVLTFRGNATRTGGAFGHARIEKRTLTVAWRRETGPGEMPWGGGAGWTGQPVLVRWPPETLRAMKVTVPPASATDFVEVIQGSLDGRVYFFDLKSGAPTRPPIDTRNPIKGSVSLDPRGAPLLFVGQGLPRGATFGLHVYSLIDNHELYTLPGHDAEAPVKGWGAFDSSGIVNRTTDSFLVGGENGLVYLWDLHTAWDPAAATLSIAPTLERYRYTHRAGFDRGIESSLAVWRNLAVWGDNGGIVQAVDLRSFTPLWSVAVGDDTDASVTLSIEHDAPMVYTGDEVDHRGAAKGTAVVRKLDGKSGEELWQRGFACEGMDEPRHEPGLFATNAVGRGDVDDLVFFMLSRCPDFHGGTLVALDKSTGKDVWRRRMKWLGWPSTTLVEDARGKAWLLQADTGGSVHLVDARTGEIAASVHLDGIIEASPAVFDSRIVITTRNRGIYAIDME